MVGIFLEEFTKIYLKEKEMATFFIMTLFVDLKDVEKAKTYNFVSNYLVRWMSR